VRTVVPGQDKRGCSRAFLLDRKQDNLGVEPGDFGKATDVHVLGGDSDIEINGAFTIPIDDSLMLTWSFD